MKILSWNLNGLSASLKSNALVPIAAQKADVICFQEIRTQDEPVIIDGYFHYWNHGERDGYSGTAILLKSGPIRIFNGFLNNFDDAEGRIITAELEDVYVVNA